MGRAESEKEADRKERRVDDAPTTTPPPPPSPSTPSGYFILGLSSRVHTLSAGTYSEEKKPLILAVRRRD